MNIFVKKIGECLGKYVIICKNLGKLLIFINKIKKI